MVKKVKIKAPFYGAGSPKQFNWVKDGFDIFGVGINIKHLQEQAELEIIVEGQSYQVKTQAIKDFVVKYNSYHQVKNSLVKVGVFSVSLLKAPPKTSKACCVSLTTFGVHARECPVFQEQVNNALTKSGPTLF
jgi:hypothetical protein